MRHNRKNILFKVLAKYIRFLKELRSSYAHNIRDEDALRLSIEKNLDLVTGIGLAGAQKFVEGHNNVSIREIYPLKFCIRGVLKHRMQCAFIDFLHEKGAYENYMKNRYNQNKCKIVLHGQVMRWLDVCGFYWSDTVEGFDYWHNISNEWEDFCITTRIMEE